MTDECSLLHKKINGYFVLSSLPLYFTTSSQIEQQTKKIQFNRLSEVCTKCQLYVIQKMARKHCLLETIVSSQRNNRRTK